MSFNNDAPFRCFGSSPYPVYDAVRKGADKNAQKLTRTNPIHREIYNSLNSDKRFAEKLRRMFTDALESVQNESSKPAAKRLNQTKQSKKGYAPYNGIDRRTKKNYNGIWVNNIEFRGFEQKALEYNARCFDESGMHPRFGFVYANGKYYLFENESDDSSRLTIKQILTFERDKEKINQLKEIFKNGDNRIDDKLDEVIEKSKDTYGRRSRGGGSNAKHGRKNEENDGLSSEREENNAVRHSTKTGRDRRSDRELKGKNKYSLKASEEVARSMSMQQCKDMITRVFNSNGLRSRYDGKFKTADEWLQGMGVDEVAMYLENDYTVQQKYLDKIPSYGELREYYYKVHRIVMPDGSEFSFEQ